MFGQSHHLPGLTNRNFSQQKQYLQEEYLISAKSKEIYFQIRFINLTGSEVVRITRDEPFSDPYIAEDKDLQDKGDRYYFTNTIKLNQDEIYMSPIDLNKEGSPPKIEIPYRPVIRYGAGVFDKNNVKKGIVVTNADLNKLFIDIKDNWVTLSEIAIFFIVDNNGQYISHSNDQKEFGNKENKNTGENLYDDYPDIAQKIFSEESGSVEDTKSGIISFRRIYLNDERPELGFIVLVGFIPDGIYLE